MPKLPNPFPVIYTKQSLIKKLKDICDMGWIDNARHGNHGGVGNTLEDLLGIEENNLPIPNASEWELKTQRKNSNSLCTLFHMEPSPTAIKFVPAILLPMYGWKHKEAGKKYPVSEMSFRQTINGAERSDRGFKVVIDRPSAKVLISFDSKSVDIKHIDWLNVVKSKVGSDELNPQPYWGFDDLKHKAGSKLHNAFYVQCEVKKQSGREFFKYCSVMMLEKFNFDGFLSGLESSTIYVDFDARTGHNHGTKFRVRQNYMASLYQKITTIF